MHRDWNVGLNGLFLVTWECCILNPVWFCVFWQLSCLSCLMEQSSQSMLILWWGRSISRMLCRDAINKVTFVSITSPLFLYSVHLHLDSRMQKRKAPNRDQPAFSLQVSGKEEGLVDELTIGIYIFSFFGMKTQEDYWSHFEGKCRKNLLVFLETAGIEQKRNMNGKRGRWSSGPHYRSHGIFFLRIQGGEWTQDSVELTRP